MMELLLEPFLTQLSYQLILFHYVRLIPRGLTKKVGVGEVIEGLFVKKHILMTVFR